jgi:hypothetical protein
MLMFMLVTPIVHMYVYLYGTSSPKFASSHFKQTRDPIMSIMDETLCLVFLSLSSFSGCSTRQLRIWQDWAV